MERLGGGGLFVNVMLVLLRFLNPTPDGARISSFKIRRRAKQVCSNRYRKRLCSARLLSERVSVMCLWLQTELPDTTSMVVQAASLCVECASEPCAVTGKVLLMSLDERRLRRDM
jgi:hypothetical protein